MTIKHAFVDHTAIYVHDIHWYTRFFEDTLGMEVTQLDGELEDPAQVWLSGGLQFIQRIEDVPQHDQLAHIAIVSEDLPSTLEKMYSWEGITQVEGKEKNWIRLPDGLILEMF